MSKYRKKTVFTPSVKPQRWLFKIPKMDMGFEKMNTFKGVQRLLLA